MALFPGSDGQIIKNSVHGLMSGNHYVVKLIFQDGTDLISLFILLLFVFILF